PRPPDEHHDRDQQGDEGPGQLEHQRALDLGRALLVRAAAVPDREVDDADRDQEREEAGDGDVEEIERVHLAGEGGGLGREERKRRVHSSTAPLPRTLRPALSRRTIAYTKPPSARTVRTASERTRLRIDAL